MNDLVKLAKEHLGKRQQVKLDWLTAWREMAEITSSLTHDDPRLQPVLAALECCDTAFEADDWDAFQQARTGVIRAIQGTYTP